MSEPLKTYLDAERGRATKLAAQIGIARSYLSDLASGKKVGSVDVMRRISEATGIDLGEMIGTVRPAELHDEATPWNPPPVRQGEALDGYLAPNVQRRQTFVVRTGALWLGVLAGDLLVIDVKTPPRPGQTVLASVTDGNVAETRILRYLPPLLLDGDPTHEPIPLDAAFVVGAVVALARGPGLATPA